MPTGMQSLLIAGFAGATPWKLACRAAATVNIVRTAAQTVDTVALVAGDRCLLTAETADKDNGIWVVSAGAWTRAEDADTSDELQVGTAVRVLEGGNVGVWSLTAPTVGPIVVGTTALTFDLDAGGGGGGGFTTAGAGLTSSGVTVNAVANADGSIVVNANDIQVGVITAAQHGTQLIGAGTAHAVTTTAFAGFYPAADFIKLSTIDPGAQVVRVMAWATAAVLPANTATATTLTMNAVGVLTIDGAAPVLNDKILVKDEGAPAKNGAYTLTTVGTGGVAAVLTRMTDFDSSTEVKQGALFFIDSGTTNANSVWCLSSAGPFTVGATTLFFEQLVGATPANITCTTITASGRIRGTTTTTAVKTSAYTAAAGELVPYDTTAGAFEIALPAAGSLTVDDSIVLLDVTGHANALTVNPNGAELIDGASTKALTAGVGRRTVVQPLSGAWYAGGS